MNLQQEAHVKLIRSYLALSMREVKKIYEPLYEKVRMARGVRRAWAEHESDRAETVAHDLAEAVRSHGAELARTPDLPVIVRASRAVPAGVPEHEILVLADEDDPPEPMKAAEAGRIGQISQTLFVVADSLRRLSVSGSMSAAKQSKTPITWEEHFLYGEHMAVLRRRGQQPPPEFEREEKPYGFEFARAGMLRALKLLFVVVAEIPMVELRVSRSIALAYMADVYTPQVQRELSTLLKKYKRVEHLRAGDELISDLAQGMPGAAREAVNYVAQQRALATGQFCEVVDVSDRQAPMVLYTASPHANVVQYTIEASQRKARRVMIGNPSVNDVKVLVDWIAWVEK
jgi:hypothetical protein